MANNPTSPTERQTGVVNGRPCPQCEGTGNVNVEIGGARVL